MQVIYHAEKEASERALFFCDQKGGLGEGDGWEIEKIIKKYPQYPCVDDNILKRLIIKEIPFI